MAGLKVEPRHFMSVLWLVGSQRVGYKLGDAR